MFVGSVLVAVCTAGLLTSELWRKDEPKVFDVLVGFVRVCRDDCRTFDVPRVVVMVDDIVESVEGGGSS